MAINMEVKKDGLLQKQDGSWKLTLTVNGDDMSMEIIQAAMGSPYGLAMVPIQYDDTPPNLDHFTDYKMKPLSEEKKVEGHAIIKRMGEKSEGEKLRQRACILCGDKDFHRFIYTSYGWADGNISEELIIEWLYQKCNIKSRTELVTNKEAQEKFRELDRKYKEWCKPSVDDQYEDNLNRD